MAVTEKRRLTKMDPNLIHRESKDESACWNRDRLVRFHLKGQPSPSLRDWLFFSLTSRLLEACEHLAGGVVILQDTYDIAFGAPFQAESILCVT